MTIGPTATGVIWAGTPVAVHKRRAIRRHTGGAADPASWIGVLNFGRPMGTSFVFGKTGGASAQAARPSVRALSACRLPSEDVRHLRSRILRRSSAAGRPWGSRRLRAGRPPHRRVLAVAAWTFPTLLLTIPRDPPSSQRYAPRTPAAAGGSRRPLPPRRDGARRRAAALRKAHRS